MPRPLLAVEDLSISFITENKLRQGVRAVDGVSFEVMEEEVVGVVGESGCGKTLTALSIMRLLPANTFFSGRVFFQGGDIFSKKESDLRNLRGRYISMVFQEPMTSLNPVFTAGYQIAEVLMAHKNTGKKQAMNEAVELLRAVKIPSPETRAKEYPHQMSGGMRQRVMIAMAIACRPSLVIADEPTTALDVTIQAQILELLDNLRRDSGMSLLLITHDLGVIAEWAKKVEIMYAGRIVEEAPVREIFLNPRHPYTMGLLESLPKKKGEKLTPIPGQVPRLSELPAGCKFAPRCRYAIKECSLKEPELAPVNDSNPPSPLPTGQAGPFDKGGQVMTRRGGFSKHLSRCIRAKEI